jgi:hypothetical protein
MEQVESEKSHVVRIGADWDKDKCVVAWQHKGKVLSEKVQRNLESVEAFARRITREAGVEGGKPTIELAIEAGDRYWVTLWSQVAGEVFIFDGKKTRRFLESVVSSGASDDKRSAAVLRDMLESPVHRRAANQQLPPDLQSLMMVLTARKAAAEASNAAGNRLYATLRDYRPSLARTTFSAPFLDLLEEVPTAAAWNALKADAQDKLLKSSRLRGRAGLASKLGADTIAVKPELEVAVRSVIMGDLVQVRATAQALKQLEATLKGLLKQHKATAVLSEVKGLGPVLQAGLVVVLGMEERAMQAAEQSGHAAAKAAVRDTAVKHFGAAPVTKRSGTKGDAAPQVSMRKAGNPDLRALSYILGLQLCMNHAWAKAAYAWHKARGKNAATIFRILSRSFIRVLMACVRNKKAFNEAHYIERLQAHGIPWALAMKTPEPKASTRRAA